MLISCAVLLLTSGPALVIGLDRAPHNPLKLADGKPQAFVFVNHDCPICNAYSPEFERLVKEFGGKVKVQLVFSEPGASVKMVKAYEKTFGLKGVTAWIDASRKFAAGCGATVVPEAVLFDAKGRKVWTGRIDDQWASLGVRRQVATSHDLEDALTLLSQGKRPTACAGKPVGCFILSPSTP